MTNGAGMFLDVTESSVDALQKCHLQQDDDEVKSTVQVKPKPARRYTPVRLPVRCNMRLYRIRFANEFVEGRIAPDFYIEDSLLINDRLRLNSCHMRSPRSQSGYGSATHDVACV